MILLPFLPADPSGIGTINPDTKNPFVFNNLLTLNDPDDEPDDTYEVVNVAVADQFTLQTEPLPQMDGMQPYIPRKIRKLIHMDGIIHAPTLGKLVYKAMQLNFYLDPVNAFWADRGVYMGSDKGFLPLTFSVPTSDTDNYDTGLIDVVAYVRSVQRPVQIGSKLQGYSTRFQIVFEMIDPRFYSADDTVVTLSKGIATPTAHTSATEYPTYPVISLTPSGSIAVINVNRITPNDENGNDMNVRIDPTVTLDGTAASAGDVITINMASGKVFKNGTLREDWIVAGRMDFWPIVNGSNEFVLDTDTTFDAGDAFLTYNRAFA